MESASHICRPVYIVKLNSPRSSVIPSDNRNEKKKKKKKNNWMTHRDIGHQSRWGETTNCQWPDWFPPTACSGWLRHSVQMRRSYWNLDLDSIPAGSDNRPMCAPLSTRPIAPCRLAPLKGQIHNEIETNSYRENSKIEFETCSCRWEIKSQRATASFMWAFLIPSTSTAFFVAFNKINGEGDVRLLSAGIYLEMVQFKKKNKTTTPKGNRIKSLPFRRWRNWLHRCRRIWTEGEPNWHFAPKQPSLWKRTRRLLFCQQKVNFKMRNSKQTKVEGGISEKKYKADDV